MDESKFWELENERAEKREEKVQAQLDLSMEHSEVCIKHLNECSADRRRLAWRQYACAALVDKSVSIACAEQTADDMLKREELRFGKLEP